MALSAGGSTVPVCAPTARNGKKTSKKMMDRALEKIFLK